MQLPPHEEWSLELLSELQRAVPVLESGSFDLDDEDLDEECVERSVGASSEALLSARDGSSHVPGGVGLGQSGIDWSAWGSAMEGSSFQDAVPTDLLSDDAMALPMSTLTSGRKRTYPNKSTFQAHVCCVMHPSQVPQVLETLGASPHFRTVRHWPHAYRIISPFDGQTHEGSCDDRDSGAGEKMLTLLTRMGLENLLLIVSRWDSGPADRLGTELFRCINEQCKELLRELQQAVRASFPPEELLRSEFAGANPIDSDGEGFGGGGGGTALCGDDLGMELGGTATAYPSSRSQGGDGGCGDHCVPRLFSLFDLGAMPTGETFRRSCGVPPRAKRSRLCGRSQRGEIAYSDKSEDRLPHHPDQIALAEWLGLQVMRCQMNLRNSFLAAVGADPEHANGEGRALCASAAAERMVGLATRALEDQGDEPAADVGGCSAKDEGFMDALMSRMTSGDLLQYSAQLREDRLSLEVKLTELGRASEAIGRLRSPIFEGSAGVPGADGTGMEKDPKQTRQWDQSLRSFRALKSATVMELTKKSAREVKDIPAFARPTMGYAPRAPGTQPRMSTKNPGPLRTAGSIALAKKRGMSVAA